MVAAVKRIGLGISRDWVSAVVMRGVDVEWSTIDSAADGGVDAALHRLLSKLPRDSWPKPSVHACVASDFAYTKTIRGLPPLTDTRALRRIVAAAPNRFFVVPAATATVTGACLLEKGTIRAAVIDNQIIQSITGACAASNLRVARIVPHEIALASLPEGQRLEPCALALSAASLNWREPVVVRIPRWTAVDRSRQGHRIKLAAAAAFTAVAFAMVAPTVAAKRAEVVARRQLAEIRPAWTKVAAAERSVKESARLLGSIAEFEHRRTSVTWLLEQLANALPANAAIASLSMDSSTVTLGVVAAHAADVVRAIQAVPGADDVSVIGSIGYEAGTGTMSPATNQSTDPPLERLLLRFRRPQDPADLRTEFVPLGGWHK